MKAYNLFLFLLLLITVDSYTQSPRTMSYQGVLTDNDGEAIPDGSYTLNFTLYDDATAGNLLWEEDITTEVSSGIFSVILGQEEVLDLPFDQQYWLGIAIDGGDELSPRTALTSVPYSLGGKATELDLNPGMEIIIKDDSGNPTHQFNQDGTGTHKGRMDLEQGLFIPTGDTLFFVETDEGMYIGPTDVPPGARKNEDGTFRSLSDPLIIKARHFLARTASSTDAIIAQNQQGRAIRGTSRSNVAISGSSNESYGVEGTSTSGIGIYGESQSSYGIQGLTTGDFAGVYGLSTTGRGMLGISETNTGVKGQSTSGLGVLGESESQDGVRGKSGVGKGVYGESEQNIGVHGKSMQLQGIKGESTEEIGVFGESQQKSGVYGESQQSFGVYGVSTNTAGVYGVALGNSAGVWGRGINGVGIRGTGDLAGQFQGSVEIVDNGQLSIDRVDPEISDNLLVWGSDKVVRTRSLGEALSDLQEGGGFTGCLNNLDFKVLSDGVPFFRVFQDKYMLLEESNFRIIHNSNSESNPAFEVDASSFAISAKSKQATAITGVAEGMTGAGVAGIANNSSASGVSGTSTGGTGVYGGGKIGIHGFGETAGKFEGNVLIDGAGQLKIDRVDSDLSDNLLVWADNKFVKTRSLSEALNDIVLADPFNGCLDNLDFNVKHIGDPVFTLNHQTGYTTLMGNMEVTSESGVAVKGTSPTGYGVEGNGTGEFGSGVFGHSVEGIGVAASSVNNLGLDADGGIGIGLKATGAMAAGIFRGDVKIEPFGKLKISDVESDDSDNILVWADDKYVKTRSLSEALADVVGGGDPFNGCLDNLDFKITTNEDPFFTIMQGGNANLKGTLTIEDQSTGAALIAKGSLGTAISAEITSAGSAIAGDAKAGGFGVAGSSFGDIEGAGVSGFSDSGDGVLGQTFSASTGAAGVYGISSNGIGVIGSGGFAGGLFAGDVLIEEMGQLKIDRVDSDMSDNILVWADNKFVKTRSLNDAVQDLLPDDADMDPENEIQKITKDGPIIQLDRMGGTVQLEDDDDENEIQTISKVEGNIVLDKNGGMVPLLDDDPTNELFNGTMNDQTLLVNFGGESTFQVNNDRCTFVDGALGVNGILDKPTITSAAENNVAVFGFNNSSTLPTISITNTTPGGPVFSAQGNSFFGNGTNTFITFTPGATQVAEFFGDLKVNGVLNATGKSFLIDHPLKPETKQLRHFSIESDKLTNIYKGNVKLDENGEAWVEMPDWFEALNKDFTYQLTCIGGFANVYIAEEIHDNKFKIAGGRSGLKISWEVSGVRHDQAAREIDQTVEILKK